MLRVFISYADEDVESAGRLYRELKSEKGIEPWLDKVCLLPGMKWKPAIRKAIRESDVFIALLSKESTSRRGYVHSELSTALEILSEFPDDQVFLIPARLDECDMPLEELREIHHVDLFLDWGKGVGSIVEVLRSRIPLQSPGTQGTVTPSPRLGYQYRVGIADLDIGLTNLAGLAERLNRMQRYFHFFCPTLLPIEGALRVFGGNRNLDVHEVPAAFYAEHLYLSADLVACLTKYPLAFRNGDRVLYNYFSGPGEADERFMFISTHLLYEFAKEAGCTFEKGIVHIIASQLVVYFTDCGYHKETNGCVMDFCEDRSEIIRGLQSMRFCSKCGPMIQNQDLKKALHAILQNEMRV